MSTTTLLEQNTEANEDDVTLTGALHEGRVLVADDDVDLRQLVVEVLRADGLEVIAVSSGDELLHAVKQRSVASWPEDAFDVIITDFRMPNGNGLEVVERLRLSGCVTPVLLISAFIDGRLRARADDLATLVLSKPFSLEDLRAAVEGLLASAIPSGPDEVTVRGGAHRPRA